MTNNKPVDQIKLGRLRAATVITRPRNATIDFADKPITCHPALHESLDAWASACGWDPQSLRQANEQTIRARHHEATIEHESDKRHGNQPDILTLSLGSVQVFYTVELLEVVIRGYGWQIHRDPLDDFDGGGFYADASW